MVHIEKNMVFGRRNNGDNGYRKKSKLKLQIRLLGVLIVIIGFLFLFSATPNSPNQNNLLTISVILIIIGMVMVLQKKGLKTLGKNITAPPPCNCCKCTNCGSRHNHWTHD